MDYELINYQDILRHWCGCIRFWGKINLTIIEGKDSVVRSCKFLNICTIIKLSHQCTPLLSSLRNPCLNFFLSWSINIVYPLPLSYRYPISSNAICSVYDNIFNKIKNDITYAVQKSFDRSTTTALFCYNSSNVDRVILGADVNYKSTISNESFLSFPLNIPKRNCWLCI